MLLSSCGAPSDTNTSGPTPSQSTNFPTDSNETFHSDTLIQMDDAFSNRDYEVGYDESESISIQLNGSSAACPSSAVQISGSTVTITAAGTYVISGTLDNGTLIVDTDKESKVQLVFDDAHIHSETSAALYILQADKVFLTLSDGSANTLSNGGTFTDIDENNIDSTLFSKEDLTMNGSGTLTVTSPGGHGIVSKDELTITSGTYTVTSAFHGLAGKDCICITNAELMITAGKDGIHAENDEDADLGFLYLESGTYNISAEGDGLSASSYLQIDGGSFSIITGGGSANATQQTSDFWGGFPGMPGQQSTSAQIEDSTSIKGIKSTGSLLVNGGSFSIDSADDALHSNSSLTVNNGTFTIASGDDGFHADDVLTITAGTITVTESYEALEGLSIDILSGTFILYATDDGLNAAGGNDQSGYGGMRGGDSFVANSDSYINIAGGSLYINAAGDAIDSNGTLTISGGDIIISGANNGDTSILDYESSGTITGGTFVGTGASMMNMNFSSAVQGVIMVTVGNQSANTLITLSDSDGQVLISREADQAFSCIILSTPDLVQGETYTLTVGSSSSEITLNNLVYSSGSMGNMGNMGGPGNMGRPGGGRH